MMYSGIFVTEGETKGLKVVKLVELFAPNI